MAPAGSLTKHCSYVIANDIKQKAVLENDGLIGHDKTLNVVYYVVCHLTRFEDDCVKPRNHGGEAGLTVDQLPT